MKNHERNPNGLSPRVRGSLGDRDLARGRDRSIPACAGEPRPPSAGGPTPPVYPRVCGGARWINPIPTSNAGLSPRVRGSLGGLHQHLVTLRSIPACAGEPARRLSTFCSGEVYPRVCGGAVNVRLPGQPGKGLSPRVRGSPSGLDQPSVYVRSIPACAGEPQAPSASRSLKGVYPRVCGGAFGSDSGIHRSSGLSPRVRGSPHRSRVFANLVRSIPACAGEPSQLCPTDQRL